MPLISWDRLMANLLDYSRLIEKTSRQAMNIVCRKSVCLCVVYFCVRFTYASSLTRLQGCSKRSSTYCYVLCSFLEYVTSAIVHNVDVRYIWAGVLLVGSTYAAVVQNRELGNFTHFGCNIRTTSRHARTAHKRYSKS